MTRAPRAISTKRVVLVVTTALLVLLGLACGPIEAHAQPLSTAGALGSCSATGELWAPAWTAVIVYLGLIGLTGRRRDAEGRPADLEEADAPRAGAVRALWRR